MKPKESAVFLVRKIIITFITFSSVVVAVDSKDKTDVSSSPTVKELNPKKRKIKEIAPISRFALSEAEMMQHEYTAEDIVNLIECNLPTDVSPQRFKLGESSQEEPEILQRTIYCFGTQFILPPYSSATLIPCLGSFFQSAFVSTVEEIIIPYNTGAHWVTLQIRICDKIHIHYIDSLLSEHHEINHARNEEVYRSLIPLKSFLEQQFSSREVLPIEILLARTQADNKACGPLTIENIKDRIAKRALSFICLSNRDVLLFRTQQRDQLINVGKELDFYEFFDASQHSQDSETKENPSSLMDISLSSAKDSICNDPIEVSGYYDVDSFLRMRAKRLGIYDGPEPQTISLSETYHQDAFITVYSKGEAGSVKMYKIYDPLVPITDSKGTQIFTHQLMNGRKFVPQDKASKGTRTVGFYSIDGRKRLCFKQWPEAPGHEIAVRLLYGFFFPEDRKSIPLPASEVILMNNQIFLVSEFIEGENLEQVLKDMRTSRKNQRSFNLEKLQKLFLFCLLTNQEDCRPQNCIMRRSETNDDELVLVDTERCLVEEFITYEDPEKGIVETRPHCFLFCFYELLQESFDVNVNEYAFELMKGYEEEQLYEYTLYEICKEKSQKNPKLCLWYSKEFMQDMRRKLHQIRQFEKDNKEESSLASLFQTISPRLAEIYRLPKSI